MYTYCRVDVRVELEPAFHLSSGCFEAILALSMPSRSLKLVTKVHEEIGASGKAKMRYIFHPTQAILSTVHIYIHTYMYGCIHVLICIIPIYIYCLVEGLLFTSFGKLGLPYNHNIYIYAHTHMYV